jgi:hypothetical protein
MDLRLADARRRRHDLAVAIAACKVALSSLEALNRPSETDLRTELASAIARCEDEFATLSETTSDLARPSGESIEF